MGAFLLLKGKIQIVVFGKILWVHSGGDALQGIIFELSAAMTGGDDAFFCAKVGIFVDLAGMDTVGAEFVDFLSEQHLFHLSIIIQHEETFF